MLLEQEETSALPCFQECPPQLNCAFDVADALAAQNMLHAMQHIQCIVHTIAAYTLATLLDASAHPGPTLHITLGQVLVHQKVMGRTYPDS